MYAPLYDFPGIATFLAALEDRALTRDRTRRGLSFKVLLHPGPAQAGEGDDAELLADVLLESFHRPELLRFPYAVLTPPPPHTPSPPQADPLAEPVDRAGPRDLLDQIRDGLYEHRPAGLGRVRFPQYELLRSVVTAPPAPQGADSHAQAKALREHYYQQRRARGPAQVRQATLGREDGAQLLGRFAPVAAFLNWLPLRSGAWRTARRMTRKDGWYRAWAGAEGGSGDLFHRARIRDLAGAHHSQAYHSPQRETQAEEALLRALLADLEASFAPWYSPWARARRRHRHVLLVPRRTEGDTALQRLLERFPDAVRQTRSTGVVLIAVAQGSGGPAAGRRTLADAAADLDRISHEPPSIGISRTIDVDVLRAAASPATSDEDRQGLSQRDEAVRRLTPRSTLRPWLAALTEVALCLALLAGLLAGGAYVWGAGDACLDGRPGKEPTGPAPSSKGPAALYKEARAIVAEQNAQAEKEERAGREVRTVVHLGAPMSTNVAYSGAIPELRGIALAQALLNEQATRDPGHKVFLRVTPETVKERFADAPRAARDIVKDAHRDDSPVRGVVGLGQSRKETLEAQRLLGEGGIPMVGTAATATDMLGQRMYRQIPPDNLREARIAAAFAQHGNVVETSDGRCRPATRAVVITDPADVYSGDLGRHFANAFTGEDHVLTYSPNGEGNTTTTDLPGARSTQRAENVRDMATRVCDHIGEDERTLVYWAARANEFTAFLDEVFSSCEEERLSVLGGNDLTNAVIRTKDPGGTYPQLRLYYAAHALPQGAPPNTMAERFATQYAKAFGAKDLWADDGRAALAWDALRLLGSAMNQARHSGGEPGFERGLIQGVLSGGGGEVLHGATGQLAFAKDDRRPDDKRLLILRDSPQGPHIALECGIRDSGKEATTWGPDRRWGPGQEHPCPRDDT